MKERKIPEAKELFVERMHELFKDSKDEKAYWEILKEQPVKSIRCNTLKISPEELKDKLEKKGWKISQPFEGYLEVMIVTNELLPGELGRALEHLLGYYYIQELASMLPVIALKPKEKETILDLCAAPGSKTTQLSATINNTGTIVANELSLGRIRILAANTERCGASNIIITRKEGFSFCKRLERQNMKFDKILVDAPCSGEGTLRSSYKTYSMWNIKTVKSLPWTQKKLLESAFNLLKVNGEIVYSTCTHAPEENEAIVDYILKKFPKEIEIIDIDIPVKTRPGITKWEDETFSDKVKKSCRVYPQDNNTEGFFLAKFRRIK